MVTVSITAVLGRVSGAADMGAGGGCGRPASLRRDPSYSGRPSPVTAPAFGEGRRGLSAQSRDDRLGGCPGRTESGGPGQMATQETGRRRAAGGQHRARARPYPARGPP